MAQTDKNFSNTYSIDGFDQYNRKNEVFLTGLSGRNYLDLHAYKFNVQEATASANGRDERQPWVGAPTTPGLRQIRCLAAN